MLKAIAAKRLIDGTGKPPIGNPIVLVRDDRIEAIRSGPIGQLELKEKIEVIECPERTILPGLIDAHVHLNFDPRCTNEAIRLNLPHENEELLALRTLVNAQAALKAGITTVRDCGGRGLITLRVRDAINNGVVIGPRVWASGMPVTTTAGHLYWCGLEADGIDEVRKSVRWLIKSGADFIKIMVTGGRMTPGSNILRSQYTVAELTAIVEEAHRLERRTTGHCLGTEGIVNAIEAGLDGQEHCRWESEAGNGKGYDRAWAEKLADKGIWVDNNLALLMVNTRASADPERAFEKAYQDHAYLRDMRAMGAKMALCTDAGTSKVFFDSLASAAESGVKIMDMTLMEAILACTKLPAEEMGLDGEIGTVEAGKRADLLVVEGDPLADITALARVDKVFRNGAEVVSGGKLLLG